MPKTNIPPFCCPSRERTRGLSNSAPSSVHRLCRLLRPSAALQRLSFGLLPQRLLGWSGELAGAIGGKGNEPGDSLKGNHGGMAYGGHSFPADVALLQKEGVGVFGRNRRNT